jgi:hypothetical protein
MNAELLITHILVFLAYVFALYLVVSIVAGAFKKIRRGKAYVAIVLVFLLVITILYFLLPDF